VHGTDNSAVLDAIATSGGRYRRIALFGSNPRRLVDDDAALLDLLPLIADEAGLDRLSLTSAKAPDPA
jgi:hypothetical protein